MASGERDYVAIAERYVRDVLKRRVVACEWTRLACRRQRDDLKKQGRKRWPFEFDPWHANDVCGFLEKLPHVKGVWASPTIVLEPWQIFELTTVFGWRRREDGLRRFDTVYEEVARKNAKSTKVAGVGLYCLTCEDEPGADIITGATTGKQARIVFNVAKRMVEMTPDLRAAFDVGAFANSIVCHESASTWEPINAKASTQDGLNPHLTILDELHAHPTRDLFDVLRSARGSRRNPLSWYVTTAGYNIEGVCFEQRRLVERILKRVVDAEHYFGIIYTLDERDSEFDERVWPKANPNLGVSVRVEEMRGYAEEAKASPDSLVEFKTKRLNVWTGAKAAWLNMEQWRACAGPVDLEELETEPCYGGLDLAAISDITALVFAWRPAGRLKAWCRFYVPEAVVGPRTERSNIPYRRWVDEGYLIATPGDVTDYDYVERDLRDALSRFNVREVAFDPWNAYDLVNRLTEDEAPMVEFRQGVRSFAAPMRALKRHVEAKTLDHAANPVLAWMASNFVARRDVNDNEAPDRKNSAGKIDGIVALLMALGRIVVHEDEQPSVYEERGVLLL